MTRRETDYDLTRLRTYRIRGARILAMPRYVSHYAEQEYEKLSLDVFMPMVQPGTVVIDVGAHYGVYSVLAAMKGAEVVAVEPLPANVAVLQRNARINRTSISVEPVAAFDRNGSADFHVSWASDSGALQEHPQSETIDVVRVPTRTIDSILPDRRVDILKIDTEGSELAILKGASHTFDLNPDLKLLVELNPSCLQSAGTDPAALVSELLQLGLAVYAIHDDTGRLVPLRRAEGWSDAMLGKEYVNLLCFRPESELALPAALAGDFLEGEAGGSLVHAPRDRIRVGRLLSKLHNTLIHTYAGEAPSGIPAVWHRVWRKFVSQWSGLPIDMKLHGVRSLVNIGHPYPIYIQRWNTFNDPIVELALIAQEWKGVGSVVFLDVGSSIGDTGVLLAGSGFRPARFIAVEGNVAFLGILRENLRRLPFPTELWVAFLSAEGNNVRQPGTQVRDGSQLGSIGQSTQAGTSSLFGEGATLSCRLDDTWMRGGQPPIDVLKIDTDGYDGEVLAGARQLLSSSKPLVVFEWAPLACDATATDPHLAFRALTEVGYDRFVWFDKYGVFNHVERGYSEGNVDAQVELARTSQSLPDWHFDIVALHPSHQCSTTEIADLRRTRLCKAPPFGSRCRGSAELARE